ncbi:zinc finger protein CONSTANS-LIKE 13 isoform X2 [Syzygium oleosum]|nr:zinc finger protein CONSTANS-LIKE 13 isoform X2 [Syzygium oleosum]
MTKSGGGKRPCDYCGESTALLYCRADSARLCFACDREVHSTNPLFAKHSRSLLCDACDAASASLFCEAERLLLCQNCDWDRHSGGGGAAHNRRPVEGFAGCPSVGEILGILGVDDLGSKGPPLGGDEGGHGGGGGRGFSDVLLWETPAFVSLDDLIVPRDDACALRAVDVPPLPKNRNATCGQHKKEMLRQLRLLAKPESNLNFEGGEIEPLDDFHLPVLNQALQPANIHTGCEDRDQVGFHKIEATDFQWFSNDGDARNQAYDRSSFFGSYGEESPTALDKYPDISFLSSATECHEVPSENPINSNPLPLVPLTSQERESAISRYKEKRKTRRYDKHIRYESRKARAESRIRIKGRFAKMDRT